MTAEAADPLDHRRPFFPHETFALAGQQFFACSLSHIHADSPSFFYEIVVDQFLVCPGNGDWIELVFRRDLPHRGQGVAGAQHAVEHHADDPLLELAVDRCIVVPAYVHGWFQVRY
jgi:hypothetical protein